MLTSSQKKYLLTIYLLGQNGEKVRITDIVAFLGVAKASTVRMMEKLTAGGYISKQPYKQAPEAVGWLFAFFLENVF